MCPAYRVDTERSSIGRAAIVLKEFRSTRFPLGVSALARRTGIPKSTLHRTLTELTRVGFLEHTGADYQPGFLLFELGQTSPRTRDLRQAAQPHLLNLRDATGQNVTLSMIDNSEVIYVDIYQPERPRHLPQRVGGRWPAHASCSGKAVLAFSDPELAWLRQARPLVALTSHTIVDGARLAAEFERIRRIGVAYDQQESVVGIVGVAAPIRTADGVVHGAVAVSGRAGQLHLPRVDLAVRTCASAIARAMPSGTR